MLITPHLGVGTPVDQVLTANKSYWLPPYHAFCFVVHEHRTTCHAGHYYNSQSSQLSKNVADSLLPRSPQSVLECSESWPAGRKLAGQYPLDLFTLYDQCVPCLQQ